MAKRETVPIVTGRTPRTPERAALAEKIASYQEAVRELDATRRAISAADDAVAEARRASDAAAAAIETAKANAVEYLKGRALGTAGEAPLSGKDARVAARDAEDILEMAREGRDGLTATVSPLEQLISIRHGWMMDALKAVLAADPVVAKISGRRADLDGELTKIRFILARVHAPDARFDRPVNMPWETLQAMLAPWDAVIEALKSDPDAPLPDL